MEGDCPSPADEILHALRPPSFTSSSFGLHSISGLLQVDDEATTSRLVHKRPLFDAKHCLIISVFQPYL